ncbi:mechanosensitive ion channel family protein [Saprospira grandis]|uniref:mechanosensitive ion channel family protein n=1 Tax=Saprospira grandis TaxID=1008 RepID=UPI0022DD64F6|nr:mechanosensitive ion channel domain-containing protein [Saprospira grandis]WBM73724.1 mechanosensitive ion channel [Saprospira grandis]
MIDYQALLTNLFNMVMEYAPRLMLALALLYFGLKIIGQGMKLINNLLKKNDFDKDLRPFIISLVSVALKILLAISVVDIVGVETTSFVAVLASIGFAVGLALQGSLSNISSGILILIFKPFRTGDMVRAGDYMGRVKEIQIFNTILETLDHRRIVIPNKLLTDEALENISAAGIIRVSAPVGISYSADIDQARQVAREVIAGCPFAVSDKAYQHQVNVLALGASSVDLEVWVWAKADDYWETLFYMEEYLKKAFDKAGIEIPFSQMDVNFKPTSEYRLAVDVVVQQKGEEQEHE